MVLDHCWAGDDEEYLIRVRAAVIVFRQSKLYKNAGTLEVGLGSFAEWHGKPHVKLFRELPRIFSGTYRV